MVFENPSAFWFIIAVPFLLYGIGYFGWKARREIAGIFHLDLRNLRKKHIEKYLTVTPLLVFCVAGFALPKFPFPSPGTVHRTGEVLFLVDVSGSMEAQKNPEQPNRVERAKSILLQVVDRMDGLGEVRISLYGFTSIARSHVPFVGPEDYPYLRESIKTVLDIYSTPGHGTSLGRPVLNVIEKFSKETPTKLIVLLSDGEIFIGAQPGVHEVERAWLDEAVAKVTENGIRVVTVGVGEREGAKIPMENSKGTPIGDYVKLQGTEYVSYLEEESLRELASRTGGEYFSEQSQEELVTFIAQNLSPTSATAIPEETLEYRSVAHWFILAAMPFWILVARRYFLK